VEKSTLGLSNFLANKNLDWKSFLKNDANYSENLDILFSEQYHLIPQLLTNTVFDLFLIEEARTIYDFIIIDSVQMVSDTLTLVI
jgi:hypothetical protein